MSVYTDANRHFAKDPEDIKTLTIDFGDWLPDGVTIADSVWTAEDGVTVVTPDNTTTSASVTISGGTDNEDYILKNAVTLSNGDVKIVRLLVRVATN